MQVVTRLINVDLIYDSNLDSSSVDEIYYLRLKGLIFMSWRLIKEETRFYLIFNNI